MNEERLMKNMKMPEAKVSKCTVMIKKKKERPAIVMYMEQKTVQTGYLHVLDT